MWSVELIFVLALSLDANAVQLTRSRELFCQNDAVLFKCTVPHGILEWTMSPISLPEKSRLFIRGYDSLNSELTMVWSNLTVRIVYVAGNATHMESSAHFLAASEFDRMTVTCRGQNEASMLLMIAGESELPAINNVHLSVHKNSSETNLMVFWEEPSLNGRPSVDYYHVRVNEVEVNVTSPRAEVAMGNYNELLHITIQYSNCLASSPAMKFNLSLYYYGGPDGGELEPTESSPSTAPVSPLNSTSTNIISVDEMADCGTLSTPVFISSLLGVCVLSSSCVLVFIFVLLKVKAMRINNVTTAHAEKKKEPVYEDIKTSKDKLHMCVNNAYCL